MRQATRMLWCIAAAALPLGAGSSLPLPSAVGNQPVTQEPLAQNVASADEASEGEASVDEAPAGGAVPGSGQAADGSAAAAYRTQVRNLLIALLEQEGLAGSSALMVAVPADVAGMVVDDITAIVDDFIGVYGRNDPLSLRAVLLKARAVSAAQADKSVIEGAWRMVLATEGGQDPNTQRQLTLEAGESLARLGHYSEARRYFEAAKTGVPLETDADTLSWARLELRSLTALAAGEDWREVEAALARLYRTVSALKRWSLARYEIKILEAELRLAKQPPQFGQRQSLSAIKAELDLVRRIRDYDIPEALEQRYRQIVYRLQDDFNLGQGMR